jgi:hypothetical protein
MEEKEIKLQYDDFLDYAKGKSRFDSRWENKTRKWSTFLKCFQHTLFTKESYADYLKMSKSRQLSIKDKGGFIGGHIRGGQRKAANIQPRQILTLDIDNAKDCGVWEDYKTLFGNAALIHSTHKHCPESPRLRLILPLDRPVNCEEYEAAGRKIAERLGIDNFDDTTFEASRLMFFPTTSKDGTYLFDYIDAEWIKADEILGRNIILRC